MEKQYDSSVWCHFLTGSLNLLVHVKNKQPTQAFSLEGNKGNSWQQAHVPINPAGPFQVRRCWGPKRQMLPDIPAVAKGFRLGFIATSHLYSGTSVCVH